MIHVISVKQATYAITYYYYYYYYYYHHYQC